MSRPIWLFIIWALGVMTSLADSMSCITKNSTEEEIEAHLTAYGPIILGIALCSWVGIAVFAIYKLWDKLEK
jgi:hypothetical protein